MLFFAVACECSRTRVSCLHHSHSLCKWPSQKKYLMIWTSEEGMKSTISLVESHMKDGSKLRIASEDIRKPFKTPCYSIGCNQRLAPAQKWLSPWVRFLNSALLPNRTRCCALFFFIHKLFEKVFNWKIRNLFTNDKWSSIDSIVHCSIHALLSANALLLAVWRQSICAVQWHYVKY